MNRVLMENIVRHIFASFALIPSSFINLDRTKSLIDKEFLLNDKLPFTSEGGAVVHNKIWGCQISAEQQEIKILLGDCTQDKDIPEFALIVKPKDAPAYGVYLVNNFADEQIDSEPMIACTVDGKGWMECPTYLQATFLAGMENMKDIGLSWNKCTNYKDQFEILLSFIKFHNTVYEDRYEGQKD